MKTKVLIPVDSFGGTIKRIKMKEIKLIFHERDHMADKNIYYLPVKSEERLYTFTSDKQEVKPEDFKNIDKSIVVLPGKIIVKGDLIFKIIKNPFGAIGIQVWFQEVLSWGNSDAIYLFNKGNFKYFVAMKGDEHFVLVLGDRREDAKNFYNKLKELPVPTEVPSDYLTYLKYYLK